MPAPDAVKRLVDNFGTHLDHYKSSGYNETEVRREYLDPFWKALGWDIDNNQGYADAYKDVIHEDAIKIGGFTKAPDYCFRIGGTRKFFLEAKKPSVDVKDDIAPAFQLRRYAWSGKLPLSVLSDFEEFSVYDCRSKPKKSDKASMARTIYCTFDQYEHKWNEIEAIFSRDAVLRGSFDKYVETSKKKRGTAEVDDAFLEEIERWRELLARNLALRNADLSVRDLNYAVQKTIDRLIFLRICEDRGTEDYGRLRTVGNGNGTYPRLLELFRRADDRYNSGLFHFRDERGRPGAPDQLTPDLQLDDKVLKDILKNLYYPESPYEFSVLPADILGQVYEQFLGKTIRLTTAHQAKIEEKPEVRKAGGVYYTPKYIVDYIVENTLGRLLNGTDPEKPKPIPVSQAEKLKVLDPACGSGSFLIVAYQYLLDWHRDQYTLDPGTREEDEGKIKRHAGGKSPKIYQAKGGEWRLTTSERKRILLNNIHGVDIDSQAVEVTKLSLLLKVLEGETQQQLQRDFLKERQRILPDLGRNIRCGNSLIGPDFYDQPDLPDLDDETRYRINVFHWESAFPEVFDQGGFDCVIGNPPYVRQESIKESKSYLAERYDSATGTADLYVYFLEKAVHLLRQGGYASYIVSSSFLRASFAERLRGTLMSMAAVPRLVDFGGLGVFADAKDTYVCIPLLAKTEQPDRIEISKVTTLDYPTVAEQMRSTSFDVPIERFSADAWSLASDAEIATYASLCRGSTLLGVHVSKSMYFGIKTGLKNAFVVSGDTKAEICAQSPNSGSLLHPCRGGQDIRAYTIRPRDEWLIVMPCGFTRKAMEASGTVTERDAWTWLKQNHGPIADHLAGFEERLRKRQDQGEFWWELRPCDYYHVLDSPKILFPDICKAPRFAYDDTGIYVTNTAYFLGTGDKYLLGLLNSSVFWFCIGHISIPFGIRAGQYRYRMFYQYIEQVPIHPIDFADPADVEAHGKMVALVERMLKLHEDQAEEKNPETLRRIADDIAATDRRIDRLVYKLYDLTGDEITLVEGSLA